MYTVRGFLKAASRGETEVIEKYFARNGVAEWIGVKDSDGNTALHLAAQEGHEDTVARLIRAGASITARNNQGYVPIALAVMGSAPGAIPKLIEAGADVNEEVPNFSTLVGIAVNRSDAHVLRILLEAKADPDKGLPLMRAIDGYHDEVVQKLLDGGANPNAEDSGGSRALHKAVYRGKPDIAKLLIEKGADIDAADDNGNTPLHIAAYNGNADCVRLLLNKGARFDLCNERGMTAHAVGADRGYGGAVKAIEPLMKQAVAESATALTATAEAMPNGDVEQWVRMGAHQVAHVGVYPQLGRRLTSIFNFESRERMIIAENMKSGQENVTPPVSFDALPENVVRNAFNAYRELGGAAEEAEVFSPSTLKKAALKP